MKRLKVLLCCILLVSLFAGCGSTPEQEPVASTEQKEQVELLHEVIQSSKMLNERNVYTVGKEVTLNNQGMITEIAERYETLKMEYDADGRLTKISMVDNDDGEVGYKQWNYVDGVPKTGKYEPNDGFTSSRTSTYEVKKDAQGRVVSVVENIVYIDADNGSKTKGKIKTEYTYNEKGLITGVKYYDDGELDHTAEITYNENGKLLKYRCVSGKKNSLGTEYLCLEFTYHMVDKGEYQPVTPEAFVNYYNCESMLGII